jgi:hypothetical protein
MKNKAVIALAALASILSTSANAQLASLLPGPLGLPKSGEAGGVYQSNNQIRTYVTSGPHDGIDLYGKAILKAAEMTGAKGYPTFAVTKHNCSTLLVNNTPSASTCYVIAIMLNDGEKAEPRGKLPVQYYSVGDVMAGTIARPGE